MDFDYATSGSHLAALKCTETYGIPSFEHVGCLNYTDYKNESVKHNLYSICDACHCNVLPANFFVSVTHR